MFDWSAYLTLSFYCEIGDKTAIAFPWLHCFQSALLPLGAAYGLFRPKILFSGPFSQLRTTIEMSSHKIINSPKQIADFLRLPLSINLATSKNKQHPSLTRALAASFDHSKLTLCLYVSETTSTQLLDDLKTHPKLAAVFCLPTTEQTIQIKCDVQRIRPIEPEEEGFITDTTSAFADEVAGFGFDAEFVGHYLYADQCVAIIAKATEFFDQTPGPLAGSLLKCQP